MELGSVGGNTGFKVFLLPSLRRGLMTPVPSGSQSQIVHEVTTAKRLPKMLTLTMQQYLCASLLLPNPFVNFFCWLLLIFFVSDYQCVFVAFFVHTPTLKICV